MKNLIKTIIFAFCFITVGSCEDEIDPKVAANGFQMRMTEVAPSLVISPLDDNTTSAVSLAWDKSDNGGITTVSSYIIEIAESGTNFSSLATANNGNPVPDVFSYSMTREELNRLINQLAGFKCEQVMSIDVRVKSTLGAGYYNSFSQYSTNVVTLAVTPYSIALPTMAFASTATIDDALPKLASSAVLATDYEGYMWLEPGQYKFYKPDSCNRYESAIVYGDDNSGSNNTLIQDGSAYDVSTAGYYLVKADLVPGAFTYSVRPITWNFIGTAKPSFPQAPVALDYDQTSKVWKKTVTLKSGFGIKFRSSGVGSSILYLGKNNGSLINYAGPMLSYVIHNPVTNGDQLPTSGALTTPATTKDYEIILDLSSPRNYSYSITALP